MKAFIPLLLFFFPTILHADDAVEVRNFEYGNSIYDVCISNNKILCTTDYGIMAWDKKTMTRETIDPDITYNSIILLNMPRIHANSSGQIAVLDNLRKRIVFYDGSEWQHFDDGIFGVWQHCLFSDSSGRFWTGTEQNGLFSWNGEETTTYSADTGLLEVQDIAVDKNGVVWFGTPQGIYAVDGSEEKHYSTEDGLVSGTIISILPDNGTLWIGTTRGISRFDGATWTNYTRRDGLVNNRVNDLLRDHEGNIWAATNGGVSVFDGDTWESYTDTQDLMDNRVTSMAVDSDNRVWLCSKYDDKGMTVFENGEFVWYTIWGEENNLPVHEITAVANDADGNIWIGWNEGAAYRKNGSWVTYSQTDGLAGEAVRSIQQGANGSIWLEFETSAANGYSRHKDGAWQTYFDGGEFANSVLLTFCETENGDIWLAMDDGIWFMNNGTIEKNDLNNHLLSNTVYDIDEAPDEALWLATDYGLVRFDGHSWRTYTKNEGLRSNCIDAVEAAPDGSIWCLSFNYLTHFDGNEFVLLRESEDSRAGHFTEIAVDDNGTLWAIKGYDKLNTAEDVNWMLDYNPETIGLYSYNGSEWHFHRFPKDKRYQYISPRSLAVDDDGIVWLATDAGLARFDGTSWSLHTVNGPVHASIYDMAVDLENVKWFATEGGISSYDGSEWCHYPLRSQLFDIEFKTRLIFNQVFVDPVSNLKWFAAGNGSQLFSYDGSEFTFHLEGNTIVSYAVDKNGVVWGASNAGVISYDGALRKDYTTEDGLFSNSYSQIYIDRNNVKWLVSYNGGLISIQGDQIHNHIPENFSLPQTFDVIEEDSTGRLWLMKSHDGVYSYNGNVWKKYRAEINGSDTEYHSMAVYPDDTVWITHNNGISLFDGAGWSVYSEISRDDYEQWKPALTFDTAHRLWLLNLWNVGIYNGVSWSSIDTYDVHFGSAICRPDMDGSVWLLDNRRIINIKPTGKYSPMSGIHGIRAVGAYPNPFNAETTIEFELDEWGHVDLGIYNIMGQKIRTIHNIPRPVGKSIIAWDGRNDSGDRVSSGTYFYRLTIGGRSANGRMMFVK